MSTDEGIYGPHVDSHRHATRCPKFLDKSARCDCGASMPWPDTIATHSTNEVQTPAYDSSEQDQLLDVFTTMLADVTKDGGTKRAKGEKPPWWRDQSHRAAIFSHLSKREHGELIDPDSGAHPYVHLAWRALAIAYQETYGMRDPREAFEFDGTDS